MLLCKQIIEPHFAWREFLIKLVLPRDTGIAESAENFLEPWWLARVHLRSIIFRLSVPRDRLAALTRTRGRLNMAFRSFLVSVANFTGKTWDRGAVQLLHGMWSENGIPAEHWQKVTLDGDGNPVPGTDWFMSESDGFGTGTEGVVEYTAQGVGTLRIHWDNLAIGSNSFSADGPPRFAYIWGDPGGSDARIDLTIKLPTAPEPLRKPTADPKAFTGTAPRS